ncbi:hypothetical protein KUTeg_021542 [Tegillarca granosa]|uniref:EGF-like domain-containing protein n=1 Tax=Tegillarca granosa TaxID=220873 RepID=A0ABQ9E3L3_TEGGR|nr:hypothetical protein KUTeg_021542 [Tegillarca granosa]
MITQNTKGAYMLQMNHKISIGIHVTNEYTKYQSEAMLQMNTQNTNQNSYIDECQRNHGNCPDDRECINVPGSFQCAAICSQGFKRSLNGQICEDIDECHVTPEVCGQFCKNVPDVNECRRGIHRCSHLCRNSIGSYKCACPAGYTLVNGDTCRDINECAEGGANCGVGHECENTQGSYKCIQLCPPGYQRIAEGQCAGLCHKPQNNLSQLSNAPIKSLKLLHHLIYYRF